MELINGQGCFPDADLPLGLGTFRNNGCGVIAAYNTMELLGLHQELQAVAAEFLWLHGMLLFGLLGVAPWSLGDYLARHRVAHRGYLSRKRLERDLRNGDIVLYTVINSIKNPFLGCHTMAAQYCDGQFLVCNESNLCPHPRVRSNLEESYRGGAWIYGFRVPNSAKECAC